jgi:hypothetical protein
MDYLVILLRDRAFDWDEVKGLHERGMGILRNRKDEAISWL